MSTSVGTYVAAGEGVVREIREHGQTLTARQPTDGLPITVADDPRGSAPVGWDQPV